MEIQTASLTNNEQTLVHSVTAKISTDKLLHLFSSCSAQNTVYSSALPLAVVMIQLSETAGAEMKRKIWGHGGEGSNLQRHYKNVNNKCHLKRPLGLSHLHTEGLGHTRSCWNNPLGTMNWSQ